MDRAAHLMLVGHSRRRRNDLTPATF
jgi:hypothetical protein